MASFNNSSKRGWKSMQGSESGGGSSSRCGGQRNEADSTISFPTSLLRTKKVDGKICEKGRSRNSKGKTPFLKKYDQVLKSVLLRALVFTTTGETGFISSSAMETRRTVT
eukprot:3336167-Rhodomonas_salina.1